MFAKFVIVLASAGLLLQAANLQTGAAAGKLFQSIRRGDLARVRIGARGRRRRECA
jgi:hypothetical protein